MKNVRRVLAAWLGFFALTSLAVADPDPTEDGTRYYDADGVPVSISKPKEPTLTPEEIAANHKRQVQAAMNKDWFVRDYEKQLRKDSSGDDQSANLYYQLSANKDLAKLAGLPDIDDDGEPASHTGDAHPDRKSSTLHPYAPVGTPQSGTFLKPFITPMSAPMAAGLPNFYSTLGGATPKSQPPVSHVTSSVQDPTDIDTPGMIAAEKNPNPETLDLSLDVLPGESLEHARDHQDNAQLLTLPLPAGADQIHRAQMAALDPKTGLPVNPTTPAVVPKAIPVNDEDAPMPISKGPVINPVRAPIGNPYDILDR